MRTVQGRLPTVLVSAPFMDRRQPSIQLGLLTAIARESGFAARSLHSNLDFADLIGLDRYDELAAHRGPMVGDWLFSVAAFGDDAPDPDAALLKHFAAEIGRLGPDLATIRRELVPAYLDSFSETWSWGDVAVVGFSSTFAQNTASFALASRLKARWPHLITVFGGANFDGVMGLEWVRTVGCIDYAVIGEGDVAFPRLLAAIADGGDVGAVPGVAYRSGDAVVSTPAGAPPSTLDQLPDPVYDEYFERVEQLGLATSKRRHATRLPIESARGCWWGAKHHCTFCGLNGSTMAFRAKSARRVVDELERQSRRYGTFRFDAVDNILDASYLRDLMPLLRDAHAGYDLFYEVKANLSRDDLRLLAQAGVARIQPGLESLSSKVLRLMNKGVRASQNVNTLRWAAYYGIAVDWNVLWGFPGETAADYADQAAVLPHLHHLQPPAGGGRIWLERFSPLFDEADARGVRWRPERSYAYVYPERVDLDRAAYFFDYEVDGALPEATYAPVNTAIAEWTAAWRDGPRPRLECRSASDHVQIYDRRRRGHEETVTLHDDLARIYVACMDRPTTAKALQITLGLGHSVGTVQEILAEFARRGLMFVDEADGESTRAVALALPAIPGR